MPATSTYSRLSRSDCRLDVARPNAGAWRATYVRATVRAGKALGPVRKPSVRPARRTVPVNGSSDSRPSLPNVRRSAAAAFIEVSVAGVRVVLAARARKALRTPGVVRESKKAVFAWTDPPREAAPEWPDPTA